MVNGSFPLLIYTLFNIAFFFQMIFINLISLVLILIFTGFKKFIMKFDDLHKLYTKKFVIMMINLLLFSQFFTLRKWDYMLDFRRQNFLIFILISFSCFLMSIIILFPHLLLINFIGMIYTYSKNIGFSSFIDKLERIIDNEIDY